MDMSYLDILPEEIIFFIYRLRDDKMVSLIIKNWYRYIGKKIVATKLLINVCDTCIINNMNNIFTDFNIRRLKYIERTISGKENNWWKSMVEQIGLIYINIITTNELNDEQIIKYNIMIDHLSCIYHKIKHNNF